MKWAVFAGENFYPGGGWNDYVGSFDSLEQARDFIRSLHTPWVGRVTTVTVDVAGNITKSTNVDRREWAHIATIDGIVERWQAWNDGWRMA